MKIEDLHIPCLSDKQKTKLVEAAEQTALRFCAPVYLVGSSLWNQYPNDLDIYVAVKSDSYLRMFTNYNKYSESEEDHMKNILDMKIQQAKIYKKQKEYFEERIRGWDFDIKFQSKEQFLQHKEDNLRLDFVYSNLW